MALSDNEQQPMKWQLPYITLEPDERLLVYASGRNLSDTSAPLHTSLSEQERKQRAHARFA